MRILFSLLVLISLLPNALPAQIDTTFRESASASAIQLAGSKTIPSFNRAKV